MNERNDRWTKCLSQEAGFRATSLMATQLADQARIQHGLQGAPAKALGETLVAGLLLASTCKTGERVSLSIKGGHSLKQSIVDATPEGTVRGYITTREPEGDWIPELGPWQEGILNVVRLKLNEKEPYVGTVPLVTGHLAKDVTFYLSQSEQIPSAVGLSVILDSHGAIESAGGFVVQILPGADPKIIQQIESNLHSIQSLNDTLSRDPNPKHLLAQVLQEMPFSILEEKPLAFECSCSRERVLRALKMVGRDEMKDMIKKDHGAEIHCDFCGKLYQITEKELEILSRWVDSGD